MARVVLDAVAEAHLVQHLEVVERALLEALHLEDLVLGPELGEAQPQLLANRGDRVLQPRLARDVVARRIDSDALQAAHGLAAQRVDLGDRLDGVAEELDTQRALLFVRREDLDDVAADAERATVEVHVVALVLDVDELPQHMVAVGDHAALEEDEVVEILRR